MKLRICHVTAELAPFAKTGGLADVAAALPRQLARDGHDVRPFLPMYGRVRQGPWPLTPVPRLQDLPLRVGERTFHVSVSTTPLPGGGPDVFLVRCPELYGGDAIYQGDAADALRFTVLARAALECCQYLQWAPQVVHCHDWHAGLVPLLLRARYAWDRMFEATRTLLTIHNIGYQGVFPASMLEELGLADARELFHQDDLAAGHFGFLKTGVLYAGALSTVSETYAREIQTAEQGMGLETLLSQRADHLFGIVNGVDYDDWDPRTDAHLAARYGPDDLKGKLACKEALMERFGLPYDPKAPVVGVVSRLSPQKGFDLLPDALPVLLQREDMRLVLLGSGDPRYEEYFDWLRATWPQKVGFHRGYDEPLAHRIEAGSDLFLMPSRYEPCGLNQMYSLRYGTVPLVRRTGGLADTVARYDPEADAGTGFVFGEFTPHALLATLEHALAVWRDAPRWRRLMLRGMREDFSWGRQAAQYVRLYERLIAGEL